MRTGEGVLGVSIFDRGGDSSEKVAEEARLRPEPWPLPFREEPHVDMNDITAREKKSRQSTSTSQLYKISAFTTVDRLVHTPRTSPIHFAQAN